MLTSSDPCTIRAVKTSSSIFSTYVSVRLRASSPLNSAGRPFRPTPGRARRRASAGRVCARPSGRARTSPRAARSRTPPARRRSTPPAAAGLDVKGAHVIFACVRVTAQARPRARLSQARVCAGVALCWNCVGVVFPGPIARRSSFLQKRTSRMSHLTTRAIRTGSLAPPSQTSE